MTTGRASRRRAALVITDIVDSTRITARVGDAAMAGIWLRHDEVVRGLLDRWRGQEVDRTDGFLLLFDRPSDALGFCRALHETLARLSVELDVSLKARAALHLGSVILLENSEVDRARGAKPLEIEGLAKPLTARVASITPGGHTLITGEAASALDDADLLHRGWWMFKGAAEPLELFELIEPGRTAVAIADSDKAWAVRSQGGEWRPVREIRHNLPVERDVFVGRAEELRIIAERFESGGRLVTLLGPGGMGKSRLARRFGWSTLGAWPGGVSLATLAEARELDAVVRAVSTALEVPIQGGDPVQRLGAAMAGRGRHLLILDNFEQVIQAAPDTVDRWLDLAPDTAILVTSRSPLNVAGESVVALRPLTTENAAALFAQRAQDARVGTPLKATEQAEVQRLVRLLDGLPLAIELAASRARLLTVSQICERLNDRFLLLRGGRPDNPRHSTLRAALDWSWDLLSPPERAALAQLSVFEGSFDLEAAEAVLDLSAWPDAPEPLELAQLLLDRSLLQAAEPVDGVAQMRMLLSVKAYATEKLASPELRQGAEDPVTAAQDRHMAFFVRFGRVELSSVERRRFGLSDVAWRNLISANLANMEAAYERAKRRAPKHVPALILAMWLAFFDSGPYRRWVNLAESALATVPMSDADRCLITMKLIQMSAYLSPPAALRALAEEGIALAERVGDLASLSGMLNTLAPALAMEGRVQEATALTERSRDLARRSGDPMAVAHALIVEGMVYHMAGWEVRRSIAPYEEALRIARSSQATSTEALILLNVGASLLDLGEVALAVEHLKAALTLARAMHARLTENLALSNLGCALVMLRRPDEAREHLEAALKAASELGNRRDAAVTLLNLASLQEQQGELPAMHRTLERAAITAEETGMIRHAAIARLGIVRLHLLQDELAAAELALARVDRDAAHTLPAIRATQLLIEGTLRARQGRREEALEAQRGFEALRATVADLVYEDMERDVQALRAALEQSEPSTV